MQQPSVFQARRCLRLPSRGRIGGARLSAHASRNGLDRWVSLFAGLDSIRDCIAFPKNNSGRDVMLDAPGVLDDSQLDELCLKIDIKE